MRTKINLISLVIITFLIAVSNLSSQQFSIYNVDTNSFPTMKATFYARTQGGTEFANVVPGDFDLWENGVLMNASLSIDCKKEAYFPPVAVHLQLDASTSMGQDAGNGEKRLDWVKQGVNTFLDTLHLDPPSQVAALSFAGQVKNYSGFVDEDSIRRWTASALKVEFGSTDFGPPYVQTPTGFLGGGGALWNLATRDPNLRRVAIFLSDGFPERPFTTATIDSIVRVAKREKVQCYAIFITTSPDPDIMYICQATGGKIFQAWTKADMLKAFREIVGDIQNQSTCKLVWTSPFGCDEASRQRTLKAKFKRIPDSTTVDYIAPTTSIANVAMSKSQLKFGRPGDGTVRQELTLSAPVADMTISGFSFNPSSGKYTIDWNGKTLPFVIIKGTSHKIYIDYVESPPTASAETILNLTGTPCNPPPVSLIAPCGGVIEPLVDFGDVSIQSTSDKTFNCIYQNTTPIPITGNVQLAGADASEFEIVQGAGAFTIQPTECLKVIVRFKPTTTPGIKNAKIEYLTDADCGAAETPLKGNAVQSSFPMPTLDFGNLRVLASKDSVYTIKNTGTVTVTITSIVLQNAADPNFTLKNVPAVPFDMIPDQTITVDVTFKPDGEFVKDNYIDVSIQNVPAVQSGRLTGFGTLPKINAPDIAFASTKVLSMSSKNLVITNPSTTEDLFIYDIIVKPQNDFKFTTGTDVTALVVPKNGGTISLPMEFTPQGTGLRTLALLVECDAITGDNIKPWKTKDTVLISGIGTGIDVTPGTYNYGNISTCGYRDQTFVVDNTNGTSTITFNSQNITGSGAAAFSVVPPIVTNIAVGQKGNVIVRFAPPGAGNYNATLELRTNNGDADITLQGTGIIVTVKPDIAQPPAGKILPATNFPLQFSVPIANLDGPPVDTIAFEISYYGKAYSYNNIPANLTAPALAGWTWNINQSSSGKLILSGRGPAIALPQTLNFKVILETYLADTATTGIIVKPIFSALACINAVSDTLQVQINTCFTEGRLIYVSSNQYMLQDIIPNPAGDEFDINYEISFEAATKIDIYNSLGMFVKNVIDNNVGKGKHSVSVSTSELPNGIYFIKMESGQYSQVRKLIISK